MSTKQQPVKENRVRKRSTIRCQIDYTNEVSIVDQSSIAENTMESIIRRLERGVMPRLTDNVFYSEVAPTITNYQDVHAAQQKALDAYNRLPSAIKQLMYNDPRNLESVLFDPKNADLLLYHNLIVKKEKDVHTVLVEGFESLKNSPNNSTTQPEIKK